MKRNAIKPLAHMEPIELIGFDKGGKEVRAIKCARPDEEPAALATLKQGAAIVEILRGTDKQGFAEVWMRGEQK